MTRLALMALVLGTTALVPVVHAEPSTSVGCSMTASDDVTGGSLANPGTYLGTMQGGPLATGSSGTLACSVQVGGSGSHSDPDSSTVTTTGSGVVTMPPTLISFQANVADPVWVCTSWTTASTTYYFDAQTGQFTTSSGASCTLAIWSDNAVNAMTISAPQVIPGPVTVGTECSDGVDNDGDGSIDYPADPDCSSDTDTSETPDTPPSCQTVVVTACASYTAGGVFQRFTAAGPKGGQTNVAGYVDLYQFMLPNGGQVTVPCVVLAAGTTPANACQSAGGVFVSRVLTLVNTTVPNPASAYVVAVCTANLVLTVNGIGVNSFPAYTLC